MCTQLTLCWKHTERRSAYITNGGLTRDGSQNNCLKDAHGGRSLCWQAHLLRQGTWKTQYGLVRQFARYKQFHKRMITLKNVSSHDSTCKKGFHFFSFLF